MLDFNDMSLTTSLVVWSMIAFLLLLFVVLGTLLFRNSYRGDQAKNFKVTKRESKGFGDLSN